MDNQKVIKVEVVYKNERFTLEVDLEKEYQEVTDYNEKFITNVVEVLTNEILSELFKQDFEVDLTNNTVTFSLVYSPNIYLNDIETKKLSEVINMEDYKDLTEEEFLDEVCDDLVRSLDEWVESKIEVNYINY